jgi:hypothetical protein
MAKALIVEKSTHFTRRVGEATVEVSAFFLGRVLGMTQHLNEAHLVKQGMRFWFTNNEVASLDQVRLPSYQLDRAVFDEEVLRRSCEAGASLLRSANVWPSMSTKRKTIFMKLSSGFLAGLVSIGLLTIGLDGAFARGRGGRYFSAGNPGGIAATSGSRLTPTPANQAWATNNA